MHPHPGFPVLQRLDDFCGACAPELPSVPSAKKKVRINPATLGAAEPPDAARHRRIAAISITAVVLIAATAVLLRRRS